ncbi:MAG: trigger factor [Planctomycetes bacterium]|nr:trigger factor [Planctomycetota bacterium]
MDVQVAETGPCRRTLSIKIPAEQVKQHLDQMFRAAAKQVDLKGFRKGKVPRAVLEKKYGPAIQAEAKEQLVRRYVAEACQEHELVTVGRAKLEGLTEEPLAADTAVEFQVHLDIRPQVELGDLEGMKATAEPTEVTDEDMEKALGDLAAQKRTLEAVEDAVADGDFARVDMTYRNEAGNEVSKREGAQINPNIPIAGTEPESFKSQLVGAEKGATITFDLTFPETFEKEEVRGKPGKVEVVIHEVLRVQNAALDDELAKSFEFDTMDALKEELRKRIGEQKEINEKSRQSDMLMSKVVEDHPFDLPEGMVEDEIAHGLAQFEQRMRQETQLDDDQIKQKLEEAQEPAREEAERRVRMFFVIDAIARKYELGVTEQDVELEFQAVAAHHNTTVDEVREHYGSSQETMNQVRLALLERKVRDFLREKAEITDK